MALPRTVFLREDGTLGLRPRQVTDCAGRIEAQAMSRSRRQAAGYCTAFKAISLR